MLDSVRSTLQVHKLLGSPALQAALEVMAPRELSQPQAAFSLPVITSLRLQISMVACPPAKKVCRALGSSSLLGHNGITGRVRLDGQVQDLG